MTPGALMAEPCDEEAEALLRAVEILRLHQQPRDEAMVAAVSRVLESCALDLKYYGGFRSSLKSAARPRRGRE